MGPFIKRVIYVAKQNAHHLEWAAKAVGGGFLAKEGIDWHDRVKKKLAEKNVPHGETNSLDRVPPGHSSVHIDDSGYDRYHHH
ncbi:hypothetical protein ACO2Q8_29165 [Larkinella sp. VNQ87]|uniref:hypothetical protein n=1 Tax=Larkinella sp. VNQ87 TaxID=3400921 RepID=UPI003C057275